jgi:hypothetical protein
MADDDPARCQQVLDHPEAERKSDREPDSLLEDVRREPVAAINGFRTCDHRARITDVCRHFVNLTVPGKSPPETSALSSWPFSLLWPQARGRL